MQANYYFYNVLSELSLQIDYNQDSQGRERINSHLENTTKDSSNTNSYRYKIVYLHLNYGKQKYTSGYQDSTKLSANENTFI